MEYRRLGKAGLKVSALSLGSWVTFGKQVDLGDAKALLKTAYDVGVNFFDNAEAYEAGESEKIMGEALAALGLPRDTFAVSSKVFWGGKKPTQLGLSAKHVRDACDAALRRLKVDYLDLFCCHRPDIDTPIEETVRAMHNLVQQGSSTSGVRSWRRRWWRQLRGPLPRRTSRPTCDGWAAWNWVPCAGLGGPVRLDWAGTFPWTGWAFSLDRVGLFVGIRNLECSHCVAVAPAWSE